MTHTFPYAFEPEESGGVLVQLVDLPEAHTTGATEAAAGEHALDRLIAALGGYIKLARKIPLRARRAAAPSPSCRPWSQPSSPCTRPCAHKASPGPRSPANSACRRTASAASSISTTARTSTRSTAPSPASASASRSASGMIPCAHKRFLTPFLPDAKGS